MRDLPAPLRHDPVSNAIIYGEESFNVKPDEYAPYYKHVRDSVGRYWFTMMASSYAQRGYLTERVESVSVRFLVQRDGAITDIRTIAGSGDPVFESICLRAIRSANPLRPFPTYIEENELKLVFNFHRPLR
jgi:TonB family protein